MSSFNVRGNTPSQDTAVGRSANGNLQLKKSAEQVVFEALVSFMYGKDTFYEGHNAIVQRFDAALVEVLREGNFKYVRNLVKFARQEMGMRSMPMYAAVKTAHLCRTLGLKNPYLRETLYNSIGRADALTEIYALSLKIFGNKKAIPQAIKKAVADGFSKFDEYQFAKYRAEGKAVWLRDVMRIAHPVPENQERAALYGRIKENTLQTPHTWEVIFTQNGQRPPAERVAEVILWKDLLSKRKLGMLALLRNIRNMLQAGMDMELVKMVSETITNPKVVKGSKVFPYQIFMAIKVLDQNKNLTQHSQYGILRSALESALEISVENVPDMGDNLWLLIDTSGSMKSPMAPARFTPGVVTISRVEMAAIFTAIAFKQAARYSYNVAVTGFDTTARHLKINPRDTVLSTVESILRQANGGATYIWAALDLQPTLGFTPETVMVFSDMQVDSRNMGDYYGRGGKPNTLKDVCPHALKVGFNFANSETTPASETEGWMQLAGYSDKVFQFLSMQRPGYMSTIVDNILALSDDEEEDELDDE